MSRQSQSELVVGCLLALSALACGDGPTDTATITPQTLQLVSGDGQSALSGAALAAPLRVRVIGSDTRPLRNASVQWSVTEGLATLAPAQSTTDASGEAETQVTIGSMIGLVRVNAAVQELTAVTFSLTARDPCRGLSSSTVSLDAPVTGALEPPDCVLHGGQFHDFYRFTLTDQQAVIISVRAESFDPDVDLFTFDDQRDRGFRSDTVDATREAKLKAILAPGRYETAASSIDIGATGPYTLRLSQTSPSAESCEPVFIVRGVTTAQQLDLTDCVNSSGAFYGDAFSLWLTAGERVELTHSSTEFGPLLQVYRASGALAYQMGGSGTGTASFSFTADLTGVYFVIATSDQMLGSGVYTLTVAEPPAAAASVTTPLQGLSDHSPSKVPHFELEMSERLQHMSR
jgi:Big-like domain-containing protein